jgi:hypothetical protein
VNDPGLFKKLTGTIWEFRIKFSGKHYRLFAFWYKRNGIDTIIICTHGILKKSGKTPLIEIDKTEKIRQEFIKNS